MRLQINWNYGTSSALVLCGQTRPCPVLWLLTIAAFMRAESHSFCLLSVVCVLARNTYWTTCYWCVCVSSTLLCDIFISRGWHHKRPIVHSMISFEFPLKPLVCRRKHTHIIHELIVIELNLVSKREPICVDVDDTLRHVLGTLGDCGILSAPVIDSRYPFCVMSKNADVIKMCLCLCVCVCMK